MNKVFLGSGILAASLATGLIAQQSSQQPGQTPQQQREQQQQGEQQQQQAQQGQQQQQQMDRMFIEHAASANLYEQQCSQQVQQQAQEPKIKALAQQIVQDHKQAHQQLQQAAQAAGIQLPSQMNEVHQAKLKMMQKMQGRQLELTYLWDQIGNHTKMVLEHRYMADNAQNPQIKQYAQQTGQQLQEHLAQALNAAGIDARAVTAEIGGSKQSGAKGTTFEPSSGEQGGQSGQQQSGQPGQSGQSGQPGESGQPGQSGSSTPR